jgi:tetratricopeptide (TPR) repeat protein
MAEPRTQSTELWKLLALCTVQVCVHGDFSGTGFFLAPDVVATCAHVVAAAGKQEDAVAIRWNGCTYPVQNVQCEPFVDQIPDPYPYPDIALLQTRIADHPWVDTDVSEPTIFPEPDRLYSVAWSLEFSEDLPRLTPVGLTYEGGLYDSDQTGDLRLQLRDGQIAHGMSGAPILNVRTGRVCAMMTRTRDTGRDGGGWGVPIAKHLGRFSSFLSSGKVPSSSSWTQARNAELFQRFAGVIRPAQRPLRQRGNIPPSLLLRPEYAVVPFLGRKDELADLRAWCESDEQSSVQLITGPAGTGKTRLAAQLCQDMSGRGWTAGFLSPTCKPESFDDLRATGSPLLAVFDYSDAWIGLEDFLIRLDAPEEAAPPTRIMLLARHSGAWWQRLVSANAQTTLNLTPLASATATPGELGETYMAAIEAFHRHLEPDTPMRARTVPPLAGQPMLVVHMAALLEAYSVGEPQLSKSDTAISQRSEIVAAVFNHEEAYWMRSATADHQGATEILLRRAMAVACMFGWDSEPELAELLTAVPDLADAPLERRHHLARWIAAFYPIEDPGHQGLLEPDVLLERLVTLALVDCPYLLEALSLVPPENADRAFAIIDRACSESKLLRYALEKELRSELEKLGPAVLRIGERSEGPLREEFIRALRTADVDFGTLETFLQAIPVRSVHMHAVAVAISRRAVALAKKDGDALIAAAMLEGFADRLWQVGQNRESLRLSMEALELIAKGAEGEETSVPIALISQQVVVANRLRVMRRTAAAFGHIERALQLTRDVLPSNQSLYVPLMSQVLRRLTDLHLDMGDGDAITEDVMAEWQNFSHIGHLDGAAANSLLANEFFGRLSFLQRYIARTELLAAVVPAQQARMADAEIADDADLAVIRVLRGLANAYRLLDCPEAEHLAVAQAEQACRQALERNHPGAATELAKTLAFRADNADPESAIDYSRQIVALRRDGARIEPSRVNLGNLARALRALGQKLSAAGYHEGAVQVTEEAVGVVRQLAEEFGGEEYLNLAASLKLLVSSLVRARMSYKAAVVSLEEIAICRRLAAIDFGRYGRGLVHALEASLSVYGAAGMSARQEDSAREVVKLCFRMLERADRLDIDISKVFAGAGMSLAKVGFFDQSVTLLEDAVQMRRERLASATLGESGPELARALGYLADTLLVMGRWRASLAPADDAFAICGRLLSEVPQDRPHFRRRSDTEQFYACLVRLDSVLRRLGRFSDADRIRQSGLAALNQLASQGNSTAAGLATRPFASHDPQSSLRSPRRAI